MQADWRRLLPPALLGLAAGILAVGAVTWPGRWFPGSRQGRWFFAFPILSSPTLPIGVAFGAYFGGIALLGVAWMWLLRVVTRVGCASVAVLAVFALWAAPFAVARPVGSDDLVAYAAAGKLMDRGFDPYKVGISVLGDTGPAVRAASPVWRDTPQPYGPLYLQSAALASRMGGSSSGPR